MEVTNGSFEDLMTPRCYFPLLFSNNDPWGLSFLVTHLTGHGGKINMGPLSGKFVTVPVALNILTIALTVDLGHFQASSYFL